MFTTIMYRMCVGSAAGVKSKGSQRLTGREYPFEADKRTQRYHQPQNDTSGGLVQLNGHDFCCWG